MKKLILIRHGESEWNKLNLFTGWTDVDLTENGIKEAFDCGLLLKKEGYSPEFCYTSVLKRSIKTLNGILDAMNLDYLPVEKNWRLNEKSYGAIQGLNKAETAQKYGDDQVLLWRRSFDSRPPALTLHDPKSPRMDPRYADLSDAEIPLTESLKDTIDRITPYFHNTIMKAFDNYNEIMIVAHGNSLRGIIKILRNMQNEEIIKFNLPTATPYVFEFNNQLELQKHLILGDEEEIRKKMETVANQGKAK